MSTAFCPKMLFQGHESFIRTSSGFVTFLFSNLWFWCCEKNRKERENEEVGLRRLASYQLSMCTQQGKTDHLDFLVCRRSLTSPPPPQPDIQGCTDEIRKLRMNTGQGKCVLYSIKMATHTSLCKHSSDNINTPLRKCISKKKTSIKHHSNQVIIIFQSTNCVIPVHLLVMWSWVRYFNFLCLSSLICKI